MKTRIWFVGLVLGLVLLCQHAIASPILPGGVVTPVPTEDYSGTLTNVFGNTYDFANGADTGTFAEIVVKDDLNPFGAGDLTFVYQVHVSTGDIGRLTGSGYAGILTDVAQHSGHSISLLSTGTHGADLADRSGDGVVVGFDFVPSILPEPAPTDSTTDTSLALLIRTNATSIKEGKIGLIDSGGVTEFPAFAPESPAVPQPLPSAAWGGLGLLLVLLACRHIAKCKRSVA